MMEEQAPNASSGKDPITSLNSNDVLLGRGSGISLFIGNQKYRLIVDEHKEEYVRASRNKPKAKIAKEILDRIHSLGGRFLRLDENAASADFAVEDGEWYETEEKAALEKIKQSLREKRGKPDATKVESHGATSGSEGNETGNNHVSAPVVSLPDVTSGSLHASDFRSSISVGALSVDKAPSLSTVPSSFSPLLPLQLAGNGGSSAFDPRLLLFQTSPFVLCPSEFNQSIQNSGVSMFGPDVQLSAGVSPYGLRSDPRLSGNPFTTAAQQQGPVGIAPPPQAGGSNLGKKHSLTPINVQGNSANLRDRQAEGKETVQGRNNRGEFTGSDSIQDEPGDDDIAEYLLSVLALSDRHTFTEQQSELENAALTDKERAEALSDLFGQSCSLDTRESKRPRRDLDRESIDFLVRQMRVEIEDIPIDKKQALIEAQTKGNADEFSDERLTKFLRCEGMNAKLAAKRFVNYWQARREVFGPEKYLLRMSLDGALRDDLVAIETGVYCQLPFLDSSGRPIIYHTPSRHTREGYTSESLLRAVWYIIEVASQENNGVNVDSSIVEVMWSKNTTVFDYDKIHDRIIYFTYNSWPVRVAALHVCCLSSLLVRIIKPIMMAMKSKSSRCRTLFHDVPDTEILEVLAGYGILDPMLPTEMGGTLHFNQSEWIAKRRAMELEEIE